MSSALDRRRVVRVLGVLALAAVAWFALRGPGRPANIAVTNPIADSPPNPRTLSPAVDPLARSATDLIAQDPGVTSSALRDLSGELRRLTPAASTTPSALEEAFLALIQDPTSSRIDAFLALANNELRERRFDAVSPPDAPPRPAAAEPSRQLLLRILFASQYARARGLLSEPEGDRFLWEAALAITSNRPFIADAADLDALAARLIDERLQQTFADELAWNAQARAGTLAPASPEARGQHWVRGLLDLALENAARADRASDFETYARRFLDLVPPEAPADPGFRERDLRYRADRIEELRRLFPTSRTP